MGKVYRVFDKKTEEEVALKLIKPEIAADQKTIERFRNELKIPGRFPTETSAACIDIGEEKGTLLHHDGICSRRGSQEHDPHGRSSFSTGTAIAIATQVCEGS